jgi:predicted PurR-regulated permease PerM
LQAAGHGLSRWLLGQGLSMLAIGTLTAVGLGLMGMPMALGLGVIAGLFAFVPFFGAVTSGALVVLLAFAEGPDKALQAALLMLAVQQIEEFVLLPFIQRWAVRLPPVLGLIAAVIFALLFGPAGVLVATPLMVMVMILVQRLYVHRVVESVERPATQPEAPKPRAAPRARRRSAE